MLTLGECRKLIPNNEKYTDKQIEEIRTSLYKMAEIGLEHYVKSKPGSLGSGKRLNNH